MEATQAERVSQLAKSLYNNRLSGSMDDATKMAESILSRTAAGEARAVQEISKESPAIVTSNDAAQGEENQCGSSKIDTLKKIISEEAERIASLRKELEQLKDSAKGSNSAVTEADSEIEKLARDIDRARQDIAEIHQHIRDLEDIKREIREAEESQQEADELAEEAEIVKERAQEWIPPHE